ncbi:ABC-three component system middle component 6 [Rhizobium sp. BK176]|uniref:ABC-three component system middle component 6 n=1 Tax=Rhizobium sp. BK176 TaxID=2587071 RepID=UPI002168015A|nr:ABC-three component system middle component 6 [Rhizobium sp. BK176]MCS4088862.1 hypothetical protein [Rhizobium sp. BK176]
MILPTKFLPPERSVIFIGGEILALLVETACTPSDIMDRLNTGRRVPIDFDMIALVISFLYAIGAVYQDDGTIHLTNKRKDHVNADRT